MSSQLNGMFDQANQNYCLGNLGNSVYMVEFERENVKRFPNLSNVIHNDMVLVDVSQLLLCREYPNTAKREQMNDCYCQVTDS